jgi:undecaprenyl-diphosphatase
MSFFLGIPALTAAGIFEALSARHDVATSVGWAATAVGTLVSFVVAYASIAWLLRYVSHHTIIGFVWYRVILGVLLIVGLSAGVLSAT